MSLVAEKKNKKTEQNVRYPISRPPTECLLDFEPPPFRFLGPISALPNPSRSLALHYALVPDRSILNSRLKPGTIQWHPEKHKQKIDFNSIPHTHCPLINSHIIALRHCSRNRKIKLKIAKMKKCTVIRSRRFTIQWNMRNGAFERNANFTRARTH